MKEFYFNHDGNIDDLVSYLLFLQAPEIKLLGVGAIDADGYVDPSVEVCRKLTDRFNTRGDKLEVAKSNSRAVNQFPEAWRTASYSFNSLPILNESGKMVTKEADQPAHLDMVTKLENATEPVTVVMTGPLTDLARALDAAPEIETKIEKLYWMGGSLDGHGNVVQVNADGTQEWNAFWDPYAVERVLASNIPMEVIGLESSEELPLTNELKMHWAGLRKYPAVDLAGQAYSLLVNPPIQTAQLYFWDILTVISALYPEVVLTAEKRKVKVITKGTAAGRMEEDPNGREITLVTKADKDLFFKKFDELLMRAK
ncbi:nucleoside hydrolase [Lactobacillus sp. M0403]|uniref:nucleoside hydrolase n=1 Tax=Lactobacillus TaxID=1578 RepID=UPI000EFB460E|nr:MULTISPECIES: nucleoside hydrolase [Lactobacillus]MBC6361542.1 ABC transporter substrate-binding protein [Lactobacillus apis]MBH9985900.1 nucleoside hydrolase [Lactobacillus sp. M0390]MBI0092263.1 nucleoside hydrolase [Lactobacillus sp. M0403]MCO6529666.1 nucleoside hydrolase [Lactobacillus sp.]RMC48409.1 ABC transporter substrate-binding protein [Lactobacillus sp. ESL0263]